MWVFIVKSKSLEKTRVIMDLVSQSLSESKKSVKSPERIVSDLICQLVEEIPEDEIKNLANIKVQQILLKAKEVASKKQQM